MGTISWTWDGEEARGGVIVLVRCAWGRSLRRRVNLGKQRHYRRKKINPDKYWSDQDFWETKRDQSPRNSSGRQEKRGEKSKLGQLEDQEKKREDQGKQRRERTEESGATEGYTSAAESRNN